MYRRTLPSSVAQDFKSSLHYFGESNSSNFSLKSHPSMISLQRLGKHNLFNRISFLCVGSNSRSSKSNLYADGPHPISQFLLFCTTENSEYISKQRYLEVRREAQATLRDYFHQTRNLPFMDAESLSRCSPHFLDRLLKTARINSDDGDVGRLLTRFMRYHPIDEFEPFFESIGLDPCEYASLLPHDLNFLSEDKLLLHNYSVLCNYGIEKDRIGKIYMEAKEVFSYGHGILQSRIQSFQNWGLPQSLVAEMIASSPDLLRGDNNQQLHHFLEKFKIVGVDLDWLEKNIKGSDSFNWKCMLEVMCLLGELGLTKEQSREVILNHPNLLLERSGSCTLCLFSLLMKFGLTKSVIKKVFHQFPQIAVDSFIKNLLHSYEFLVGINMPSHDIGRMFCLHPLLLGALQLKTVGSLVHLLNCGVNRIRKMVDEDPYVLKKWVCGVRVDRLPQLGRVERVRRLKTRFLERRGYVENSEEMEEALRSLKGKGDELQERFDCLVKSGLSHENVAAMMKSVPSVLNMSKDVIERKIDLLVRELGYPVTVVLDHPIFLTYTIKMLKLRLLMHKWLKDEGAVKARVLNLKTLLKCSEEKFLRCYVNSHPKRTQVWERMTKEMDISSELP